MAAPQHPHHQHESALKERPIIALLIDRPESIFAFLIDRPEGIVAFLIDRPEGIIAFLIDSPEGIIAFLINSPEGPSSLSPGQRPGKRAHNTTQGL